jgi:hypothetical protein
MNGAGDGIRTRDIDLGKVALYQLSYSRVKRKLHFLLTVANLSNPIVTGGWRRFCVCGTGPALHQKKAAGEK